MRNSIATAVAALTLALSGVLFAALPAGAGSAELNFSLAASPPSGSGQISPPPTNVDYGALPSVDYTFASASATATGSLAGGADTGDSALYDQTTGPPEGPASDCTWASDPASCVFPTLAPGPWEIISSQSWSTSPTSPATTVDTYFVVPEAPILSAWALTDTVAFSGTGMATDSVTVMDTASSAVCSAVVGHDNRWSCTSGTLANGQHSFYALQTDLSAGASAAIGSATYRAGGTSSATANQLVTIDATGLPAVAHTFLPAGIRIIGTPNSSATKVGIDLYSWTAEDGYRLVAGCPAPIDNEGWESGSYDFLDVSVGVNTCTIAALTPGVWRSHSHQNSGTSDIAAPNWVSDYFVVPVAPTIASITDTGNATAALSGTTIPGDRIHVVAETDVEACAAIGAPITGAWSCTTETLASGTHTFRAYLEDLGAGENSDVPQSVYLPGGLSAASPSRSVSLAVPIVPDTPSTPSTVVTPPAPALPSPIWSFTVNGLDLNNVHPGDHFTIIGTGLPVGATIAAELHSTPVALGQAKVAPDGKFTLSAIVPVETVSGQHHLVLSLVGAGLQPTTSEQALTVVDAVTASTGDSPTKSGATSPAAGTAETSGTPNVALTQPNILTHSLNSIADVVAHPGKIPAAFAIGLVLLIFAVLPAHLLNATIGEQYERFARRMPRLRTRPRWLSALVGAAQRAPVLGAIVVTTLTALLFGFADPKFGFTFASLRLFLACAIALFVVVYVANALTAFVMRQRWSVDVVLSVRPLGLILTVAGVVISRILDFSPGLLIGLVIGLSIAGSTAAVHAWKAVLIRTGFLLVISVIAWLWFSAATVGEAEPSSFGAALFSEILVAITTEGIVILLVELLPFRLLEGQRLFTRSRALWAGVYLIVVVLFIVAIVPWEGNWAALGNSLWAWIAVVLGFGAVCVGIYLYFRFWASPLPEDHHQRVDVSNMQ